MSRRNKCREGRPCDGADSNIPALSQPLRIWGEEPQTRLSGWHSPVWLWPYLWLCIWNSNCSVWTGVFKDTWSNSTIFYFLPAECRSRPQCWGPGRCGPWRCRWWSRTPGWWDRWPGRRPWWRVWTSGSGLETKKIEMWCEEEEEAQPEGRAECREKHSLVPASPSASPSPSPSASTSASAGSWLVAPGMLARDVNMVSKEAASWQADWRRTEEEAECRMDEFVHQAAAVCWVSFLVPSPRWSSVLIRFASVTPCFLLSFGSPAQRTKNEFECSLCHRCQTLQRGANLARNEILFGPLGHKKKKSLLEFPL